MNIFYRILYDNVLLLYRNFTPLQEKKKSLHFAFNIDNSYLTIDIQFD